MEKERKKVVVIGGGFTGVYCAKNLEDDFDVILVDNKNYFEFTPGVLRTLVEPGHDKHIQVLHKEYLKRGEFIRGDVKKINDLEIFVGGKKIPYDYLIIATGSSYKPPIKEEGIVASNRAMELKRYHNLIHKSKNIIIVGGGIAGVELAAEICTHFGDKELTLIHSKKRLMERNRKRVADYAEKFLLNHGVRIIYNDRAEEKKGKTVRTKGRKEIKADLVFFCIGIQPNSDILKNSFPELVIKGDGIKTNNHLQLEGKKNIFVGGDVSSIREEKTAQNSEEQGEIIVENIKNMEVGKALLSYKSKPRVMVISLGKSDGIIEYKNFVLTGFIPAFLKGFVEKKTMMRYGKM